MALPLASHTDAQVGSLIAAVVEGKDPVWLTLQEALQKKLPVPIRLLVKNYQAKPQAA